MKKSPEPGSLAPRPNLDFSKGVRGKHLKCVRSGASLVLIAPGLVEVFPDSESANKALSELKNVAERTVNPQQ